MKPSVTLTIDLEDPTDIYRPDGRYVAMAEKVLDLCDQTGRRATFFCVGRVAETAPELIRKIAVRGHEIAYHSHAHRSLTDETPQIFRAEALADKIRLEELAGRPVVGFRAPRFSLVPSTLWATECLAELGFQYSSSVMPTSISRFGFTGLPFAPFRWRSGLIELPMPVVSCCGIRVPFLGGIYLYALPGFMTSAFLKLTSTEQLLWTYAHPYDLDRDEPYTSMPNTPDWVSRTLWLARRRAELRLRKLLDDCPKGALLCERASSWLILHGEG